MKKIILFLYLTFAVVAVYAQNTFAPIGAEWHYFGTYSRQGFVQDLHSLVMAKSTGDTVVAGISCRKIEQAMQAKTISYYPNGTADTKEDAVALRNLYVYDNVDTVFIFNENFGRFTPLYVFNAHEGDTICLPVIPDIQNNSSLLYHPLSGDTSFCFVVDSVRYVVYDTTTLKTFYTHFLTDAGTIFTDEVPVYSWSDYYNVESARKGRYAERIGGVGATLLPCRTGSWVEKPADIEASIEIQTYNLSFRCYHDPVYNINVSGGGCDSLPPNVLGIEELTRKFSAGIFPNPSSGRFFIAVEKPFIQEARMQIADICGRKMMTMRFPPGKNEMEVDTGRLQDGIYFLWLDTERGKYYQKIIIRH